MTNNLKAALRYAKNDMGIFPVYEIGSNGYCACDKGKDCSSPGKHPRTKAGSLEATTDVEQVKKWWSKWPDANIGWRLGNDYVAVDVDEGKRTNKNGKTINKKGFLCVYLS